MYTNKNTNLNSVILEVPATIHKQIMEYRKSIFVSYQICRVFDIINTKPCANCAGFGHNSNKCRNAVTCLNVRENIKKCNVIAEITSNVPTVLSVT